MKTWTIYKSPTCFGTWQFSFVSAPNEYYYYFIYDNEPPIGWRFCSTKHPEDGYLDLHWNRCDPARTAIESNWLEVLVMIGKSEVEVMRMMEERRCKN